LEVEKRIKEVPGSDAVLVSVDSMESLRPAYPNYFLDTGVFLRTMDKNLSAPVGSNKKAELSLSSASTMPSSQRPFLFPAALS
jgi:hypothetical protein